MFSFIRSINKELSPPQSGIDQEVESHLQKTRSLGKSFERRGVHGYGKKKIFQPKQHKKYEMSARTPKKVVVKKFDSEKYANLFSEGCCKPIESCCMRTIQPAVIMDIHEYWSKFAREEKRKKLVELLVPLERQEISPSNKLLCGRRYELKLTHKHSSYSVCPVSFYFLTSSGHELISSLFSPFPMVCILFLCSFLSIALCYIILHIYVSLYSQIHFQLLYL